jgi:alpha-ribazole phosphatase/probable phosphoglycerate mutase
MVTRLYLIRHGETEDADTRRYKGHIDVPLSEKGIKQMEQLSKYIYQNTEHRAQSTRLKAVYCSDLSRAIKSAEIIAKPHGIKPIVVKALRERNFGIWEGMNFDEIRERYPKEFKAWADNPLEFSPIKGESTIEVRDRVLKALSLILSKHGRENTEHRAQNTDKNNLGLGSIAIVAHGGVNRIILCHYLGIPLENIFRIEQDFGALNIIEFHDGYPVIKLINGRTEYGI